MKILFLINSYFPYGVAFSSRAVALCRLLYDMNYDVHVIATNSMAYVQVGIIQNMTFCTYQIISTNLKTSKDTFFKNKDYLCTIRQYLKSNDVDYILTHGDSLHYGDIKVLKNEFNVKLILEQCEWFDISSYKLGILDIRYHKFNKMIRSDFADGIIAISTFLYNHFTNMGVKSVRIPTILDVENIQYRSEYNSGKVNLIYTGNCGKSKEFLIPVIEALSQNQFLRNNIIFNIYGPSKNVVLANIGNDYELLEKAGDSVRIHGYVPQDQIENKIRQADYQIFIRPCRRSSDAGFPTKLGESLAVGTPVIANKTGDISLYIKDGENGYLLNNTSVNCVEKVLSDIVNMQTDGYIHMRKAARLTAERYFDYRVYRSRIKQLFEDN